ncbi:hypothetical protein ACQPX6_14195 [Actinomycetospora sp. CA-101289]|uniref:hypothetical protein n=1 Tax=Actinomycetospora sp. CA-101289 TaxID=3239893 RepID=UPI003D95984B
MEDATRALLGLWDVADANVRALAPGDWARTLPGAGPGPADVAELAVHLTGVHYAGPDTLRAALGAARHRAVAQLADRVAGDPVLGAQCLDMCLHVHDLTAALGAPADLRDHEPAAREACRLVLRVLPRLLVAAVGADDATLRLAVRAGDDRAVHVSHGHVVPADGDTVDAVEIDPGGLLLLLTGRLDAESLRAAGALDWSGPAADAFVHRARLLAA